VIYYLDDNTAKLHRIPDFYPDKLHRNELFISPCWHEPQHG
jgi:hypothetical protein